MKILIQVFLFIGVCAMVSSCEKDEGKLPNISFKSGAGYVSADASIAQGDTITIGINASKAEENDPLKKFNISKSINGGTATSLYNEDLSGPDGDAFSFDFSTNLEMAPGQVNEYIFTVTNRDGLVNQASLKVTITN